MHINDEVVGVGVDIVEFSRIKNIRFLDRFAEYFLTPAEIMACEASADRVSFLASRFAAKEATIKAFPTLLKPHDFEIIKEGKGPAVRFASVENENKYRAFVSITHSTEYAAGYATVTKK